MENESTADLFESQIGRFLLAGGISVDVVNVGKWSTNTRDANRSSKVCSSFLVVNPLAVRMSPIEVVESVADYAT